MVQWESAVVQCQKNKKGKMNKTIIFSLLLFISFNFFICMYSRKN